MKQALIFGQTGTPLEILACAQYQNWRAKQSSYVQNWLSATGFSGEGVVLVPQTTGQLERVVSFVKDFNSTIESYRDINKKVPSTVLDRFFRDGVFRKKARLLGLLKGALKAGKLGRLILVKAKSSSLLK